MCEGESISKEEQMKTIKLRAAASCLSVALDDYACGEEEVLAAKLLIEEVLLSNKQCTCDCSCNE